MTTLAQIVSRYVPADARMHSDFSGDRGWVWITNEFYRILESKRLFKIAKIVETGVEVDSDYWIDLPSDFRAVDRIFYPKALISDAEYAYKYSIVGGKIKLDIAKTKDADPDTFTLSGGTDEVISINDTDCTADLWNDFLLVLTNGTYDGDTIIIYDTAAVAGGVAELTFRHTQAGTIDSTTGYLTDEYLILSYYTQYTDASTSSSVVSINSRYEWILGKYLTWQGMTLNDKRRKIAEKEYYEAMDILETEEFTPSLEQARPEPIELVGYVDANEFDDSEYIGE